MISVIPTQTTRFRTFGWVQDPSDFRSLCDVVAIFDKNSSKHCELKESIIPRLVEDRDGKAGLIEALEADPLRISYADLVGTSFTPRSAARCNGIVQAAVPGQVRAFIGDWPADNFVRWAHALGFIEYHYEDDTFSITPSGLELTEARTQGKEINEEEKKILTTAVLAYPPAVRILKLLAETEETHLTKFELGKKLGFVGENGFTSLPQSILVRSLAVETSAVEKSKMRSDWDGSSDKYARMIAKWLIKLGLAEQAAKEVTVSAAGTQYSEKIGQAYMITAAGITALNRADGRSRHGRISKNVCFEMLATKGKDREFLRTRRAYILKIISEGKTGTGTEEIKAYLESRGIRAGVDTILDDVRGLINIGLNIVIEGEEIFWNDAINDFVLPLGQNLTCSDLIQVKEKVREKLNHLSHDYLALIDLAYDPAQNRLFEMKTLELLTDECGYQGLHLGGSRKPDGICYTRGLEKDYGIIIDTKAYSGGYNLPISQADEMERYVRENQTRDPEVNANGWWEGFPADVKTFYFMFVAGHFKGNYLNQIDRIWRSTGVSGTAVDISRLLITADRYKGGVISHEDMENSFFQKDEMGGTL
ncbi:MAG TPA: hypothetical protein IAC50_02685 [Candidatus Copromorpha excrementigallinarum]|uniref:Restriction endonuclease n=1 Tax=Candidatus Allocopromorpha excrementigallinarum TaxID=2840742 RepID=A0A9D1I0B1_9FIRM|nr:hypothetical protein [Candidatus Copromorpha excrementigallinarum]